MKYPKHNYIRSTKLLRLVASLECQVCGFPHSQAAHTNWGSGKGRGIKGDDNAIAALCLKCHFEIDQGAHLSKQQRQEMWLKAHRKTISALVDAGKWPEGVPLPSISAYWEVLPQTD